MVMCSNTNTSFHWWIVDLEFTAIDALNQTVSSHQCSDTSSEFGHNIRFRDKHNCQIPFLVEHRCHCSIDIRADKHIFRNGNMYLKKKLKLNSKSEDFFLFFVEGKFRYEQS
jgi:hypothetical protein